VLYTYNIVGGWVYSKTKMTKKKKVFSNINYTFLKWLTDYLLVGNIKIGYYLFTGFYYYSTIILFIV